MKQGAVLMGPLEGQFYASETDRLRIALAPPLQMTMGETDEMAEVSIDVYEWRVLVIDMSYGRAVALRGWVRREGK